MHSRAGGEQTHWLCKACGNEFDTPVDRQAKSGQIKPETMLKRLGVDPSKAMVGGDK